MLPRCSPRLKGLSPAPQGPGPKPKEPRRVKDLNENSVRQATYQAELAAWLKANTEHADLMKIRKARSTAAWKAAKKSVARDAAPPPQLSADELRFVGLPAPAERGQTVERGTSPLPRRFRLLSGGVERWLLEIEAVASRCGAGQAPLVIFHTTPAAEVDKKNYVKGVHGDLFCLEGLWFDPNEHGGMPGLVPHPSQTLTDARACAGVQIILRLCIVMASVPIGSTAFPSTSMAGSVSSTKVASQP